MTLPAVLCFEFVLWAKKSVCLLKLIVSRVTYELINFKQTVHRVAFVRWIISFLVFNSMAANGTLNDMK